MASLLEKIEKNSVIYLLEFLGFTINFKKFGSDSSEGTGIPSSDDKHAFSVPKRKARSIKQICQLCKKREKVSSLIGKLVAIGPAFSPAPLKIRYLQIDVNDNLRISKQ